jgi:hypothetical protein
MERLDDLSPRSEYLDSPPEHPPGNRVPWHGVVHVVVQADHDAADVLSSGSPENEREVKDA